MSLCRLSSFSLVLLLFTYGSFMALHAQQKANDFTKRIGLIDGRKSIVSGKLFSSKRLSDSFSRRIKIEEWPTQYSPFGGRRFTTNDPKALIKKRVEFPQISSKPAKVNGLLPLKVRKPTEIVTEKNSPSVALVEFRDEYYTKLNQRMDEWMEKVNNMSLRDINRFQFRKGRPAEPGFPVQRAGSATQVGKKLPTLGGGFLDPPSKYWLGPRKSPEVSRPRANNEESTKKGTKTKPVGKTVYPTPQYGPKKIRVQVNSLP